jgi:hypothetical protein
MQQNDLGAIIFSDIHNLPICYYEINDFQTLLCLVRQVWTMPLVFPVMHTNFPVQL